MGKIGQLTVELKLSKTQWIEAALLAPTTVALGSALLFGIVVTSVTLVGGLGVSLFGGLHRFLATLRSSGELIGLCLMMLAAAAGLGALWLTILLGRQWTVARPRRRSGIVVALLVGLGAVVYWFSLLFIPPYDAAWRTTLLLWTGLLVLPVAVALRRLWVLLRPRS